MITAGSMEIIILSEKINSSFHLNWNRPLRISKTSFLKITIVLSAVAKCNTTVKVKLSCGRDWSPKIAFANSKWPLEETGKNSVKPCIIPRIIASI